VAFADISHEEHEEIEAHEEEIPRLESSCPSIFFVPSWQKSGDPE